MGTHPSELSGGALSSARLGREGTKLPGRDNWVINYEQDQGRSRAPRSLPCRPSHSYGLRAMGKWVELKALGDVGFPGMDDNRFWWHWVWLGPHVQGRNDASSYSGEVWMTHQYSTGYLPRHPLRWLIPGVLAGMKPKMKERAPLKTSAW